MRCSLSGLPVARAADSRPASVMLAVPWMSAVVWRVATTEVRDNVQSCKQITRGHAASASKQTLLNTLARKVQL